ncbi:NAD(P)H-binding protein [Cytophagaceae bacterium YF14B1]|uniref:NAD(P)H-binding protein n=1 Tax=Xanthocytophaga flava TaxID=3048013 RepID=A0AAE3U8P6_9BACT|nr:NAD(P)H-binding protein [Xanthocytophaga flavus]MDJ1482882.1 NAD(P)H-binding protein [Xanthocytophaga flavus]
MKVVITGSLGNIGKPLVKELVQKGHTVTVISSKSDKQKDIEAIGAIAAIGVLEDVSFLVSVFTGADAVYAMIPPNFTTTDSRAYYQQIGRNYVQAIRQTGVKRVVHLSSWGAHLDKGTGFILGSHDVECLLNELKDVAVTHLRAGFIYYNLYNFIDMIKRAGFIRSNYGDDDKIVMVAPEDIASAAAEELVTVGTGINVRYVASGEYTAREAASILGAVIGKPDLKWVTVSNEQMQAGMEQHGVPSHIIINSIELGASIHNGSLKEDYELHKPLTIGKVKLEDFAKDFAVAFAKN